MNREIKFRAWNSKTKEFECFELHNITVPDRLLCQHDYPVQQFTGMLDKNGVEIYEGDIILCKLHYGIKDSIGIVHYFGSGFIVDWRNQVDSPLDEIEDFEVIGNIFENKDLLCDHMSVLAACKSKGE